MHYQKSKKMFMLFLISAHLLLVFSCNNSTESEPKQQPTMPPSSSMAVDLSVFVKNGGSLEKAGGSQSRLNFATAALSALIVNTWVVLGLAVPVAIFARALKETPTLKSDGKFHWEFTVLTYSADLAGWIDTKNKQSMWEMYVSQGTKLDHFLFYKGHANLNATAGDWLFYDISKPGSAIETVKIEWLNTSETNRTLTFLNVLQGNAHFGDQLKYSINGETCKIEFYNAVDKTIAIISWNSVTTAGYIQIPGYNNGLPAYWDENHNDIP